MKIGFLYLVSTKNEVKITYRSGYKYLGHFAGLYN